MAPHRVFGHQVGRSSCRALFVIAEKYGKKPLPVRGSELTECVFALVRVCSQVRCLEASLNILRLLGAHRNESGPRRRRRQERHIGIEGPKRTDQRAKLLSELAHGQRRCLLPQVDHLFRLLSRQCV